MTEDLKKIAGHISEAYLKHGKCMNEAIFNAAERAKMNEEIIKRLCEFANQNVYLSLFHADKTKRGNISFDLAKADEIIKKIKELNMAEEDYLKAPKDFRLMDEYGQEKEEQEDDNEPEQVSLDSQIANLHSKLRLGDRLGILLSAIKTMKAKEEMGAEDNILKISSYCKGLIFNGESFGDMAKLAMRYTQQRGFNLEKTAKLYTTVGEYLTQKGFKVPMELTKTSELKINETSSIYQPLEEYHMSLIKISGFNEIEENLEKVCKYLRNMPKKESGLTQAVK